MFIRKVFINVCVGMGICGFLAYLGHSITTWEFWVISGGMFIILLNNGIGRR